MAGFQLYSLDDPTLDTQETESSGCQAGLVSGEPWFLLAHLPLPATFSADLLLLSTLHFPLAPDETTGYSEM